MHVCFAIFIYLFRIQIVRFFLHKLVYQSMFAIIDGRIISFFINYIMVIDFFPASSLTRFLEFRFSSKKAYNSVVLNILKDDFVIHCSHNQFKRLIFAICARKTLDQHKKIFFKHSDKCLCQSIDKSKKGKFLGILKFGWLLYPICKIYLAFKFILK